MDNALLFFTIAYGIGTILIGFLASRGLSSTIDYFNGTHGISGIGAAIANETSVFSEWLFIGYPAMVYAYGAHKAWVAVGLFLGGVFNWLIIGRSLHDTYVKGNDERKIFTLPQLISDKVGDEAGVIRRTVAGIIAIFTTLFGAIVLATLAGLFASISRLNYNEALILLAVIALATVSLGGFISVHHNSLFNAFFVGASILFMTVAVLSLVGRPSNLVESLMDSGIRVRVSDYLNILKNGDRFVSISDTLSQLSVGFGIVGLPHIYNRLLSIKSEKEYVVGRTFGITTSAVTLVMVALIAMVGRAYLSPDVLSVKAGEHESIYIILVSRIVDQDLGLSVLAGLLMLGVIVIGVSAVANAFLTAASSVCLDIMGKSSLLKARVVIVVILVLSVLAVWRDDIDYISYVKLMWALIGATIGPVAVMSILWKKTNKLSVYLGMFFGLISTLVWHSIKFIEIEDRIESLEQFTGVYSLLVGFAISTFVIILIGVFAPRKAE